jgi:hypothetical protein
MLGISVIIWKRMLYVTHEFNLSESKLKPLPPYKINKMHYNLN